MVSLVEPEAGGIFTGDDDSHGVTEYHRSIPGCGDQRRLCRSRGFFTNRRPDVPGDLVDLAHRHGDLDADAGP